MWVEVIGEIRFIEMDRTAPAANFRCENVSTISTNCKVFRRIAHEISLLRKQTVSTIFRRMKKKTNNILWSTAQTGGTNWTEVMKVLTLNYIRASFFLIYKQKKKKNIVTHTKTSNSESDLYHNMCSLMSFIVFRVVRCIARCECVPCAVCAYTQIKCIQNVFYAKKKRE